MSDIDPDNVIDCQKALTAFIAKRSGDATAEGSITLAEHVERRFTVNLGTDVTTWAGGAEFVEDPGEFGLHHFEIGLGPSNSKRLIEFLLALPAEPEEG